MNSNRFKNILRLYIAAMLVLLSACDNEKNIPSQDVSSHFSVERNKSDKNYVLKISHDGKWEVFAGNSPQNIDMNQIVAKGNNQKTVVLTDFPADTRMFFKYVWEQNSSVICSERLLPMEGAYNVRDLGGYKTKDGKSVKWGCLFRSGDLNLLSSADLAYLSRTGIKTIIDFRTEEEKNTAPDKLPSSHTRTYKLPIGAGNIIDMAKITTVEEAEQALVTTNIFLANACQQQYKDFFGALMEEQHIPVLFHCSAGKDRAGFAAALFLSSLGVERETIIADYLLSSEYVREKYASLVESMPVLAPVFDVRRNYITAAFETIDSEYGGIDNFLVKNLEVDLVKMKTLYTE